jgi:two-component system, OmpR family, sensor histidine kinase TctE
MPRIRTLRGKLLAWLAVPLLVLWSVSALIDYDVAKRFVNLAYDRALLEAALDLGRQIRRHEGRVYLDVPDVALQMMQTRESGRLYYLVTAPNGEYVSGEPGLPDPAEENRDRIHYYDAEFRDRGIRLVALRVPVQPGSGLGAAVIRVGERVTVRAESAGQMLARILVPQALLILVAGLAVWIATGKALAPLVSLRGEIEQRSHRDLSELSGRDTPQEVQPLIHAMNGLLGRLARTISSQQRFIADAAHQLRTPIAGIKTQAELALREAPPGDAHATLQQLHTATEQATRLVNQLLMLARAEPGLENPHTTAPVELAGLARDVTSEWVPRALSREIDLGFEGVPDAAPIAADAFLLREMLHNVIDNAVRYTQPGGRITVRVAPAGDATVLSVEDNGPGVPEAERERVFERFYRVLGSGTDGCGLGLSIVREIAQSHGARVTLAPSDSGRGTVVRIAFPRSA